VPGNRVEWFTMHVAWDKKNGEFCVDLNTVNYQECFSGPARAYDHPFSMAGPAVQVERTLVYFKYLYIYVSCLTYIHLDVIYMYRSLHVIPTYLT